MIWFFLGLIAVVGSVAAIHWRWSKRVEAEVAEGAEIEWVKLQEADPELLRGMDRAKFVEVYRRVHFPRFPGYALASLCAFAASLPLTFGVLAAGSLIWERLGLSPNTPAIADRYLVEEGRMRIVTAAPSEAAMYVVEDFARFYYFFGVVAVWLVIVAYFMRRYHQRRPGYLRDEIIRARGKP